MTPLMDAIVGNRSTLEPGIGFEQISRAARLVLFSGLNAEIDRQSERWKVADLALQALGADTVGQVDVQHVAAGNFHEGPHQSLLTSPVAKFPNVSCMAYTTQPFGSQFDRFDTGELTLAIETMVIAGPVAQGVETDFETIVHRRIYRTTEAVHAVIRSSVTLLNTVLPIQTPPKGGILTQSWLRTENSGPRYLWHGSRLQYTLQRNSSL